MGGSRDYDSREDREVAMKPGQRTTEFLALIALNVGTVAASFEGSVSPKIAAILGAVSVVGYAISRGFAKQGTPGA